MGEILKMTAFLVAVCVVSALALALTDAKTAPLIEKHKKEKEENARKEVLPGAERFEDITGESAPEKKKPSLLKGLDGSGKRIGYVGKTEAKGFGGAVEVMAGIDPAGKVTGVKVLNHKETPGLGTNAVDPEGPVIQSMLEAGLEGMRLKKEHPQGKVDAITGVTITSGAVTEAVRKILEAVQPHLEQTKP